MLTLLTGGARSGKSSTAVRVATKTGGPVVYVATAEPGDEEMRSRIARHQAERPAAWTTIEAPRELVAVVGSIDPGSVVIVDCLALWITNLLDHPDDTILDLADELGSALAARTGDTIVVTNEVGGGVVPDNALARRFRDLLGSVNQRVRGASDRAYLCVAGGVVEIADLDGA